MKLWISNPNKHDNLYRNLKSTSNRDQHKTTWLKHNKLLSISYYSLYLLPKIPIPPPVLPSSPPFLAAPSRLYKNKSKKSWNLTKTKFKKKCKKKIEEPINLSRRCSGVKPSSLPLFPLLPPRAWALSRSFSLWFPCEKWIKKTK